jgi:hypothetical protein
MPMPRRCSRGPFHFRGKKHVIASMVESHIMKDGGTKENLSHSCFRGAVFDLGFDFLGIRFAIETIPPFLMAGTRFFLAGLILFAIARVQDAPRSKWADWWTALIVGACLLLGGNGGVTLSEKFIDSGLASLIVATVPIYITLLGDHGVNIATMSLSRNQAGGTALTVLNLDTAPSEELLAEIRASGDIHSAQVIEL